MKPVGSKHNVSHFVSRLVEKGSAARFWPCDGRSHVRVQILDTQGRRKDSIVCVRNGLISRGIVSFPVIRAAVILFALAFSGCASQKLDSKSLADSYRRWLNGPGRAWVEQAKSDPRYDQSDAMDRQARWEIASALVSRYEEEK